MTHILHEGLYRNHFCSILHGQTHQGQLTVLIKYLIVLLEYNIISLVEHSQLLGGVSTRPTLGYTADVFTSCKCDLATRLLLRHTCIGCTILLLFSMCINVYCVCMHVQMYISIGAGGREFCPPPDFTFMAKYIYQKINIL